MNFWTIKFSFNFFLGFYWDITDWATTPAKTTETINNIRCWIEENNCMPKAIVGDEKFHTTEFTEFYRFHGIIPYPLGPRTPWPNRAETAVRLFKRQWMIMAKIVLEEPSKTKITIKQMVKKCVWAKNCQLTISGYSPLEIATGRKPPDLLDFETATPELLTCNPGKEDLDLQSLQRIALGAHLEARQLADLKHDLAKRVKPSDGPFAVGEKVFIFPDNFKHKDLKLTSVITDSLSDQKTLKSLKIIFLELKKINHAFCYLR